MISVENLEAFQHHIAQLASTSSINERLAAYVASHLREVSLMSATELAEAVGVSQSSVSRFCVSLGYKGYTELVHTLRDLVREEWHAPDRLHHLRDSTRLGDTPLIQEEMANLNQLQTVCEAEETRMLVELIATAPQFVLAGARTSATLLPYGQYFLSKVRDHVAIATPTTALWTNLACHFQEGTFILAVAFPRYPRELIQWLSDVSEQGYRIAILTDRPGTVFKKLADPIISVPLARSSLFDSYAGPIVYLNYLVRQVALSSPNTETRLKELEKYEATRYIYQVTAH